MSRFATRSETRRQTRNVVGWLALVALGAGCQREKSAVLPAVFEDISLIDQDGASVSETALSNRALLVGFMFTSCPVVCPQQTEALAEVRAALPPPVQERVQFVSVSVDPENDTPHALKEFARAHRGDEPGWSFVRADAAGTQRLTSRLAALDAATGPAPSAHSTTLYLFARGGQLVQRYRGAPLDVPHLVRELIALDSLEPSGARLARN